MYRLVTAKLLKIMLLITPCTYFYTNKHSFSLPVSSIHSLLYAHKNI